jgi:hypothetical protein
VTKRGAARLDRASSAEAREVSRSIASAAERRKLAMRGRPALDATAAPPPTASAAMSTPVERPSRCPRSLDDPPETLDRQ